VWPEPVQRVASFLRAAHAEARLEEFADETPTVRAAARAVGTEPDKIVKSLVFVCDGRFVVALIPGDRRADADKIARAVGASSARVGKPDEVLAATGFEPGAVAPFPHTNVDRVLIDRRILAHDEVWVGAGSVRHMAAVRPEELLRLTKALQMDAVEDREYHSE
jgi:prolyl-tRNA editing enzyme YbaK/EbsC (Cys-tRNA(Pro) deacylase)